ncbi:hypothetical protein ACJMK2_009312 [Sinanodonta woodiana]|uniref:Uncharacterized protein n=1 Tax=Sinanodonta woodiana TaxID=1069815 RepID=A0ABD3VBY7_SINWO
MHTFKILTGICAIIFLQISSSYGLYDGCVFITCPWMGRQDCSINTIPAYRAEIVSRNHRCIDQDDSHEHHGGRHKRGGNSHESDSNYRSNNGVFYTIVYSSTERRLTVHVWNRCQITLRVCQGTPTMSTSKPQSTKGSLPPMSTSPGYLPSMTKSTTRVKTIIPTTKSVQVTTRSTNLPTVTTRTTKRPQTVEPTTTRQQVTTKTWIRTQMTTQNIHTVTPKSSRRPITLTSKGQDVITTTTKRQDITSEHVIPKTTAVPQPFPSGEPSNAEHVKQELRNHEDPQYGLMIGVPVGLVVITAVIFSIIWLCRRGTHCSKEEKKVSELSKGLSIVYEEKSSSALPPSYGNPVYGKLTKGNINGKSSTTPEKPKREITMESSTKKSYGSDRIYEEIPSVRLSVHGTVSSTTSGLKSSKETNASGEPLPTMNGYSDMKGTEYYYMKRNFLLKN